MHAECTWRALHKGNQTTRVPAPASIHSFAERMDALQITTVDSREGGLLQLRISCSAERVAAARKGVLEHLRSTTEFQGFRNKQKVPEDMIVRAGGGQQEFDLAVLEDVMNAAMNEARPALPCRRGHLDVPHLRAPRRVVSCTCDRCPGHVPCLTVVV